MHRLTIKKIARDKIMAHLREHYVLVALRGAILTQPQAEPRPDYSLVDECIEEVIAEIDALWGR